MVKKGKVIVLLLVVVAIKNITAAQNFSRNLKIAAFVPTVAAGLFYQNHYRVNNAVDFTQQKRITHSLTYGACTVENLRSTNRQGELCRLYPNQDRLLAMSSDNGRALFAVCDGHGKHGDVVATKVVNTVCPQVLTAEKVSQGFVDACKKVQDSLVNLPQAQNSGTTFVAGIIQGDQLTPANIGDSRLIVVRPLKNQVIFSTKDHKANPRIQGLALSRALGDVSNTGIKRHPDVFNGISLQAGDYIVLASDGYWDVVSNKSTQELIKAAHADKRSCHEMAQALAHFARGRDSRDDISVFVVRYQPQAN